MALERRTGAPVLGESRACNPPTSPRQRRPRVTAEVAAPSPVPPFGGLALAAAFLRRFRVAQAIDERVHVFKLHLPFHESDHVLAQTLSLYVGGECLGDQG